MLFLRSNISLKIKIAIVLALISSCQLTEAVIYSLNDTEYLRMPPIYHLDDYELCIHEVNGTYCYVDMELVSDTPSELLHMIHEYSDHTSSHFNHTLLHYGICLTKTCKLFLQGNGVMDSRMILERCLNDSLWRDYQLKTRLSNKISCKQLDDPDVINIEDTCAAILMLFLGLLNVMGSFYDIYFIKGGEGNRFLLSFSVKRNFEKLVTHKNTDPLQERLKGLYGVKCLTIMLVIFAHSSLPLVISSANPHLIEQTYNNIMYQLYFNGTMLVQTFFVLTGCLMAFNTRIYLEKNTISWISLPKGIIMRWIRLTPAYAVILIFSMTWIRFLATGPLWEVSVGQEMSDCRRVGWWNMIYVNNYIDNSQCMAQTWFLAANMHLYILGLIVSIFANTSKRRTFCLSALFIVGFVIPPTYTYLQDLDAVVLMAPERSRNFLANDPTFNNSYKRSHTNVPGFVLGLMVGNLIYNGLKDKTCISKYKKLGLLYSLTVPMAAALMLSGVVFYGNRPRPSIYIRTMVSALYRPLFSLLLAIFLMGMVFKFENVYRRILEWDGWRIPARVSYSAYLIHVTIIRVFAGMNTTLLRSGITQCIKEAASIILMSFLIAYPFWLLIEAPLNEAIPIILGLSKRKNTNDEKNNEDSIEKPAAHKNMVTDLENEGNLKIKIRL